MNYFKDSFWGNNGFEELKKYIKQGGDFCKDVAGVLQERSELEMSYSKNLCKLANKIAKASKDSLGTLAHSWQIVASEMESEGELHRNLAVGLVEEIIKPLKIVIETQHRSRKNVETVVDKHAKTLQDLRNSEIKAKKNCYLYCKESERVQDQLTDARVSKGKILSDKDIAKLESKQRKAEEAMKKADNEYYSLCVQAERARLEWESAVYRGSSSFQTLEEERIVHLQEVLYKYKNQISALGPRYMQGTEHLNEAAISVNVAGDIQTIISQKGTSRNIPEQILPDFFAEDLSNKMNKDRRRESIEKFLLLLKHDIERERRGKQGVENLARVFQETPTFTDEDSQQDIYEKIQHMKCVLTFLEATRYKLQCSLADIENKMKPTHPLSRYIEQHKDKQGMTQTVLKVPSWMRMERRNSDQDSHCSDPHDIGDRGLGDGTSVLPDNFDEYNSYSEFNEPIYGNLTSTLLPHSCNGQIVSRCKVIYEYEANLHDELTIKPGDIINIYEKDDESWWHGEINGAVGIFPATYVQEIK